MEVRGICDEVKSQLRKVGQAEQIYREATEPIPMQTAWNDLQERRSDLRWVMAKLELAMTSDPWFYIRLPV